MRLTLGFCCVLVVATLSGCASRNLAYENGADLGGVDLAPPVDCFARGEADCESPGSECVAQYCDQCGCDGPTFVACRSPNDKQKPCPAVDCSESGCEGCWMFDEQSCASHAGCSPIYCESCIAFAPVFQGCFGPNEGAPYCPPYDCVPTCAKSSECPAGQFCHATGQPYCACEWTDAPCNGDADCGAGEVCHWSECTCEPGSGACIPACKGNSDCALGEECEQKHCRDKTCKQDGDCPAQFSCMHFDDRDACRRTQCASDSACDGGYCVDGQCYASAGMCTWQAD